MSQELLDKYLKLKPSFGVSPEFSLEEAQPQFSNAHLHFPNTGVQLPPKEHIFYTLLTRGPEPAYTWAVHYAEYQAMRTLHEEHLVSVSYLDEQAGHALSKGDKDSFMFILNQIEEDLPPGAKPVNYNDYLVRSVKKGDMLGVKTLFEIASAQQRQRFDIEYAFLEVVAQHHLELIAFFVLGDHIAIDKAHHINNQQSDTHRFNEVLIAHEKQMLDKILLRAQLGAAQLLAKKIRHKI